MLRDVELALDGMESEADFFLTLDAALHRAAEDGIEPTVYDMHATDDDLRGYVKDMLDAASSGEVEILSDESRFTHAELDPVQDVRMLGDLVRGGATLADMAYAVYFGGDSDAG